MRSRLKRTIFSLLLLAAQAHAGTALIPRSRTEGIVTFLKQRGATDIIFSMSENDPKVTSIEWVEPASGPVTLPALPNVVALRLELRGILTRIRAGERNQADLWRGLAIYIILDGLE